MVQYSLWGCLCEIFRAENLEMKATEVPNPRCSSACDCTCVLTRNQSLSRDSHACHAHCFVPAQCKVRSRVSDALSQALCNLSLAFLTDFTLSDSTALIRFIVKLFSLTRYTLLFVWIERQDHSVHMSPVLQVQHLYTAGIPLLEVYLLPMANNRTRKERLSQEQNGR